MKKQTFLRIHFFFLQTEFLSQLYNNLSNFFFYLFVTLNKILKYFFFIKFKKSNRFSLEYAFFV